MKLLDLYCGAGGAAMGYHRAGFEVIGVDIKEQPNYPFEFIQSGVSALEPEFIDEFDIIHASPPCQAYMRAGGITRQSKHPALLELTRELLNGREYVIENTPDAPLYAPMVLCGTMFNLRVIRHRGFEINSNVWVYPPRGCNHNGTAYKGDYCSVYTGGTRPGMWGNTEARKTVKSKKETVDEWREAMGIDWMDKAELIEAIPPAYTEWIGKLIIKGLNAD